MGRWDNIVGGKPVSGRERAFRMWMTLGYQGRESMGLGAQFECTAEDVAALPWDAAGEQVKTRWNGPRVELDGGDDTPDLAQFAPSLESLLPVKTLGSRCVATHDWGTDHHERRHFIDRAFCRDSSGVAAIQCRTSRAALHGAFDRGPGQCCVARAR